MSTKPPYELPTSDSAFAPHDAAGDAIPVHGVTRADGVAAIEGLSAQQSAWVAASGWNAETKTRVVLPNAEGGIAAVLFGLGDKATGEPSGAADLLLGALPQQLPAGTYALGRGFADPELASLAWGLGAYKFTAYKAAQPARQATAGRARLVLGPGVDADKVRRTTAAISMGRDLINMPANDMGPAELEGVARLIAGRHAGSFEVITGDALVERNFPLIHAVGRASSRPPRLIDLTWGREGAPRITIVGKGVCFDSGGLDIKPAAGMLLMKKDMGGAAAALALADMVMGAGLDVRLRLLIPAVENSIGGCAFRPGDIIRSRAGTTVEIGNTDAEGRLVLADALALGDEEAPDLMVTFATLTGAARVALGPDLPPCFIDDDQMAAKICAAGARAGDPVWRMPFWPGYDRMLSSDAADMSNTGESPFAGAVTAALFLKRFVKKARHYAHFDIYGWRPAPQALGPRGGEPHAARAMFDVIAEIAARGAVDG